MEIQALPEKLQTLVNDELTSGERILWMEPPTPTGSIHWVMWMPMIFGIPYTLFSLFWIAMASGVADLLGGGPQPPKIQAAQVVFSMFGIPFLLVGLALITSPWWIRRRLRKSSENTVYLVTDKRAIVFDGGYYGDTGIYGTIAGAIGLARMAGKGIIVRSYEPDQLGKIQRVQRDDGTGDLLFGDVVFSSQNENGHRRLLMNGFYSVPDVKEVETLLRALENKGEHAMHTE